MGKRAAHSILEEKLQALLLLNPDVAELQRQELLAIAERVKATHFPRFREFAELLVAAYRDSPTKRAERELLKDYFQRLERAARNLITVGDLAVPASAAPPAGKTGDAPMALVARHHFSTLDWFRVEAEAKVPQTIVRAVDAFRRRNELLSSVLEIVFQVLLRIDPAATVSWQLAMLDQKRDNLDQDLVRDIILSWLDLDDIPGAALEWTHEWSADPNLLHQWPNLVRTADRLLRRQAVRCWQQQADIHTSNLDHLRMLLEDAGENAEKRLFPWIEAAIQELGERVDFFVRLDAPSTEAPGSGDWQSAALHRELRGIEAIFVPLMIHADLFFVNPGGGHNFALAVFGLAGAGRHHWEEKLEKQTEAMVRTVFLRDLKSGVPPLGTFSKIGFKDPDLERQLLACIDFGTKQFDSLRQREKAVRLLTIYHASQRQPQELDKEVARRYRGLMRTLHADSLAQRLNHEQFAEVEAYAGLPDLSALVTEARKYLSRRRALDASVEEMTAVEIDFSHSVRQRRLKLIRRLLS